MFGFPLLMAIGLGLAFRSQPPERPVIAVLATSENALARGLLASQELHAVSVSEVEATLGLARTKYALVLDLRGPEPIYRFDPMLGASRLARAIAGDALERAAGRRDVLSRSRSSERELARREGVAREVEFDRAGGWIF